MKIYIMNKKRLKDIAILVGFVSLSTGVYSQTTINAGSNSVVLNGNLFEYSIGEMTLISTEQSGNLIVTQGYLQPQGNSSTQSDFATSSMDDLTSHIRVYPNPTENLLFIETLETLADEVSFQLVDATGKVVLGRNDKQVEGLNKYTLDLTSIAAGTYFLLIQPVTQTASSTKLSFKIQKLH